jgi:hypothetical protein
MYKFFDYIFFRGYDFYKKRGSSIPIDRGIQVVSFFQIFLYVAFLLTIDYCFDILDRRYVNKYNLGLPVGILILVVNEIRYKRMGKKNQFKSLYEQWAHENPITRKRKGIVLFVILPAFLLLGIPVLLWLIKIL